MRLKTSRDFKWNPLIQAYSKFPLSQEWLCPWPCLCCLYQLQIFFHKKLMKYIFKFVFLNQFVINISIVCLIFKAFTVLPLTSTTIVLLMSSQNNAGMKRKINLEWFTWVVTIFWVKRLVHIQLQNIIRYEWDTHWPWLHFIWSFFFYWDACRFSEAQCTFTYWGGNRVSGGSDTFCNCRIIFCIARQSENSVLKHDLIEQINAIYIRRKSFAVFKFTNVFMNELCKYLHLQI